VEARIGRGREGGREGGEGRRGEEVKGRKWKWKRSRGRRAGRRMDRKTESVVREQVGMERERKEEGTGKERARGK
jgi:hypothetical protein